MDEKVSYLIHINFLTLSLHGLFLRTAPAPTAPRSYEWANQWRTIQSNLRISNKK